MKKTVLITGAGGLIGTVVRNALSDSYNFRSLSLVPIPDTETVIADIRDLSTLLDAFRGVDSVIHLAAFGSVRTSWDDALHTNIIGTYNVFEAAHQCGVKQVIFASSNHAVGGYELEHTPDIYFTGLPLLDHQVPTRPDSLYGVSKCFGEDLGRYYADRHGLHFLSLRIGAVNGGDTPYPRRSWEPKARLAALWLSYRDLVQLVDKSLQADHVRFDIVYGISNNRPHYYDLEHTREVLGYVPQDGADVALVREQ